MPSSHPPKLLFICSHNQWRSLTAEMIFRQDPRFAVRSAGTSPNARHVVSQKDLDWADQILCMENKHEELLQRKFAGQKLPPIVVLDIGSHYRYMDPELTQILKARVDEMFS